MSLKLAVVSVAAVVINSKPVDDIVNASVITTNATDLKVGGCGYEGIIQASYIFAFSLEII